MHRHWERIVFEEELDTQDQATQVEQGANQPEAQAEPPAAPAQVEQGTQTEPAEIGRAHV